MQYTLSFQGGIGKHIIATSLVRWVSEKFPEDKIIVVSPYPEVFENNPRVWRNLTMNQPYLFEDYVRDSDMRQGEPYTLKEYYKEKKHLAEVYPKAYGFGELNEKWASEIYLSSAEKENIKNFCKEKPTITMQISGGPLGMKNDMSERNMPYEMGQTIADILIKKGFRIEQVRGEHERSLKGTEYRKTRFRDYIALASGIKGHIGIDSSMVHACGAFQTPQLIFWAQTDVKNLGYSYPGALNKWREGAMHSRPAFGLPDQANGAPFRVQTDYWNYSKDEIEKMVEEFLKSIETKS